MIMIDVSGGFVKKGRMIFMFGNKLEKIEKLAAKLDEEELREMERLYRVKAAKKLGLRTQLTYGEKMKAAEDKNDFRV